MTGIQNRILGALECIGKAIDGNVICKNS